MALMGLCEGCQRATVPVPAGDARYYNEDATWLLKDAQTPPDPKDNWASLDNSPLRPPLAIDTALLDLVDRLILMRAKGALSLYALQIYQGDSRQEALRASKKIQWYLNDTYRAHIRYRQPHYLVQVQYFFSPLEAHRLHAQIANAFPQTILLPIQVPFEVLFPPPAEAERYEDEKE